MSAAELSGAKPTKAKRKAKKVDRHPWDWYVEQAWVTYRLCDVVELERHVHYIDPTCGNCTIPQALTDRGFMAFGTDKFQRTNSPLFLNEHDFIGDQMLLIEHWHPLSIVMNPPFSCQDGKLVRGLAEKFVRKALAIATHKVAVLLPVKWLASAGRVRLFQDFPPSIYILSERPSMPPATRSKSWARGRHGSAARSITCGSFGIYKRPSSTMPARSGSRPGRSTQRTRSFLWNWPRE